MAESQDKPVWSPTPRQIARANLTRFIEQVRSLGGAAASIADYDSLYE